MLLALAFPGQKGVCMSPFMSFPAPPSDSIHLTKRSFLSQHPTKRREGTPGGGTPRERNGRKTSTPRSNLSGGDTALVSRDSECL